MARHFIFGLLISFYVLGLDCSLSFVRDNGTSGCIGNCANATNISTDEGSNSMEETNSTSETRTNLKDGGNQIAWPGVIMLQPTEYFRLSRLAFLKRRHPETGIYLFFMSNGTVFGVETPNFGVAIKKSILGSAQNDNVICDKGVCVKNTGRESIMKIGRLEVMDNEIVSFTITMVFYMIMIVLGIAGNILILICVFVKTRQQNSTSVLISSLAISDILTLGYCLPLQLLQKFFQDAIFLGPVLCGGWYYIRYFSIVISTVTMTTMAVERYIAVCMPLQAKSWCTVNRARIAVVITWLLSLAICSPVVFRTSYRTKTLTLDIEWAICDISWSGAGSAFALCILLVTFILPLGVMIPTYLRVIKVLMRSTKSAGKLRGTNGAKAGREVVDSPSRSRLQVVKMLLVMVIVFVLCWGPLTIYEYLLSVDLVTWSLSSHKFNWFILSSVAFGNSFLNPIIYFSLSRTYREFLKRILKRLCCYCTAMSNGGAVRRTNTMSDVCSSVTYTGGGESQWSKGDGNSGRVKSENSGTNPPDDKYAVQG